MDQLTTFLLAGQETTATAAAWCLLYLSRDQNVQDRLRNEIVEARSRSTLSSEGDLSADTIQSLPYLEAVTVI